MYNKVLYRFFLLTFFIMFSSFKCSSQPSNLSGGEINRRPAVAGQFYSSNPKELSNDLSLLFMAAPPKKNDNVIAILSPHAGYVFSGATAAAAFNQIDASKSYDNIFILTSSHRVSFDGASIYYIGHYNMPLGEVKVNRTLAKELVDKHSCFTYRHDAHTTEHSLEVQLPFLQHIMKKDFQIIPIVIGTNSVNTINEIAKALSPHFNSNNLFIISTDFSHYPTYETANTIDRLTIDAILSNNSENLMTVLAENAEKKIRGLSTSLCGWSAVLTLLKLTEDRNNIQTSLIAYRNSGDSEHGDREGVVGYAAISFSTKEEIKAPLNKAVEFSLSKQEKKELLELAEATLKDYILNKNIKSLTPDMFSERLSESYGVFISLYMNKRLRGCIGQFFTDVPLYQIVQQMAIASATQDTRFRPVSAGELPEIDIEISVLSPMQRIYSSDEIELGKHGIYIVKGNKAGTFLPQVATETGWSVEEFLGHCARDKAGLSWDGWKTAELYIYSALVFDKGSIK